MKCLASIWSVFAYKCELVGRKENCITEIPHQNWTPDKSTARPVVDNLYNKLCPLSKPKKAEQMQI